MTACAFADDDAESTLTAVGDAVPAFELTLLDETTISSSDLEGKVVLLNFFATWCGPCVAEMPHLQEEVWEQFEDEPFTLIAVGREHNADELTTFRDEQSLPWAETNLWAETWAETNLSRFPLPFSSPATSRLCALRDGSGGLGNGSQVRTQIDAPNM